MTSLPECHQTGITAARDTGLSLCGVYHVWFTMHVLLPASQAVTKDRLLHSWTRQQLHFIKTQASPNTPILEVWLIVSVQPHQQSSEMVVLKIRLCLGEVNHKHKRPWFSVVAVNGPEMDAVHSYVQSWRISKTTCRIVLTNHNRYKS